jgi:hypothetical protein
LGCGRIAGSDWKGSESPWPGGRPRSLDSAVILAGVLPGEESRAALWPRSRPSPSRPLPRGTAKSWGNEFLLPARSGRAGSKAGAIPKAGDASAVVLQLMPCVARAVRGKRERETRRGAALPASCSWRVPRVLTSRLPVAGCGGVESHCGLQSAETPALGGSDDSGGERRPICLTAMREWSIQRRAWGGLCRRARGGEGSAAAVGRFRRLREWSWTRGHGHGHRHLQRAAGSVSLLNRPGGRRALHVVVVLVALWWLLCRSPSAAEKYLMGITRAWSQCVRHMYRLYAYCTQSIQMGVRVSYQPETKCQWPYSQQRSQRAVPSATWSPSTRCKHCPTRPSSAFCQHVYPFQKLRVRLVSRSRRTQNQC